MTLQLDLPVFQGTIDTLIRLTEAGEIDIVMVALAEIARQLLAHMDDRGSGERLADWLALAARLLYLKSQALLQQPARDDEEMLPEEAPEDLAARLEEYNRYRSVSELLRQREEAGNRAFSRPAPAAQPPVAPSLGLDGVTLDDLLRLVRQVLANRPAEPEATVIPRDPVTLAQKLDELAVLLSAQGSVSFLAAINRCRSRVEVVVMFLAVLELLKLGKAQAVQQQPFGDILLEAAPGQTAT